MKNQVVQRFLKLMCLLFPLLCGIVADQITKGIARDYLLEAPAIHLFNGFIQFSYVENRGGFLGYLNVIPAPGRFLLLTFGVSLILFFSAIYIVISTRLSHFQRIVSSLILAGGTGNLLDRILNNGGVIDFISIGFASCRTGIFNLADILILSGAFYLGFSFTKRSPNAAKTPQ